jgi:hypothetical protein
MSLTFDPKEGLIVVPTRLWGPSGDTLVRLALDTGATGSVVNWDRSFTEFTLGPRSRPFVSLRVTNGEGFRMTKRDFLRDHQ